MHLHVCGNPWHDLPMLAMVLMHQPELFVPIVRLLRERIRVWKARRAA